MPNSRDFLLKLLALQPISKRGQRIDEMRFGHPIKRGGRWIVPPRQHAVDRLLSRIYPDEQLGPSRIWKVLIGLDQGGSWLTPQIRLYADLLELRLWSRPASFGQGRPTNEDIMKIVKKADILPPAGGLTPALTQKSRVRREALRTVANIEARSSPPRNDLLPALRMEFRPINELRVPKRRLRKAIPAHSADLADSIGDFGLCKLITISDDGEVVDGISTLEKLKELGITEAPCLVVPHLPRRDRRRLRIALNRIQEKGAWDISELHTELAELQIEFEGNLHIPGIEPPELDILLQEELNSASNPLDQIPGKPSDPVSRRGDIWEIGKHVIACGDARDKSLATAILGSRLVQLLLTDPPYNVKVKGNVSGSGHREFPMASGEMSDSEFAIFLVAWLRIQWDVLSDGGLGFCFMDWRGLQILLNAVEKVGFTLLNIIVWAKPNAGMGSLYRSRHEFLLLLKKGAAPHTNNIALGKHGRWRSNLWEYPGASSFGSEAREGLAGHPTPKPLALLQDAILDVTLPGDVLFDGFTGSGSTLIAAENTGRIFCGTELDAGYVDLTLQRWMMLTTSAPRLRETGERFDEVKTRRSAESSGDSSEPALAPATSQDDDLPEDSDLQGAQLPKDGTP